MTNVERETYFKSIIIMMISGHGNKRFAIITDSVKSRDAYREQFVSLFDEVPGWLAPKVTFRNTWNLSTEYGISVSFLNSADSIRGMRLDGVLICDELDDPEVYANLAYMNPNHILKAV